MFLQELVLFNPKLSLKPQVVVLNKIDLPDVAANQEQILHELRALCGHTRVMAISAATGRNVAELMMRVRKLVESLPEVSADVLEAEDEERVDFAREDSDAFEILCDLERYPGQFRVVGEKIEKVSTFLCSEVWWRMNLTVSYSV